MSTDGEDAYASQTMRKGTALLLTALLVALLVAVAWQLALNR